MYCWFFFLSKPRTWHSVESFSKYPLHHTLKLTKKLSEASQVYYCCPLKFPFKVTTYQDVCFHRIISWHTYIVSSGVETF